MDNTASVISRLTCDGPSDSTRRQGSKNSSGPRYPITDHNHLPDNCVDLMSSHTTSKYLSGARVYRPSVRKPHHNHYYTSDKVDKMENEDTHSSLEG